MFTLEIGDGRRKRERMDEGHALKEEYRLNEYVKGGGGSLN